MLDPIDDEHVGRHAAPLELQSELFLARGEDRSQIIGGRHLVRPAQLHVIGSRPLRSDPTAVTMNGR